MTCLNHEVQGGAHLKTKQRQACELKPARNEHRKMIAAGINVLDPSVSIVKTNTSGDKSRRGAGARWKQSVRRKQRLQRRIWGGWDAVESRPISAQVGVSSDGGVLLLQAVDHRWKVLERFAHCFDDYRQPERTEHSVTELLRQRTYGLVRGSAGGQTRTSAAAAHLRAGAGISRPERPRGVIARPSFRDGHR